MSDGRRKKFVSKWIKTNPLEIVADRIKPVAKQSDWYMDLRLKQSTAINDLIHGTATRDHMTELVRAQNMTDALLKFNVGTEYHQIVKASEDALIAITNRFESIGRYVPTGPEMNAIRDMLELHMAQLDVCTVGDVQKAYEYSLGQAKSGRVTRLNSKFKKEIHPS